MMKNLLVFITPEKKFSGKYIIEAKVQIDNSISLGWKKEDILIIANFKYTYHGVKAIVVGDEHYCAPRPRSIKTAIIPYLIDEGIIEPENLYWNHDFDAYQLNSITEAELKLDGVDVGLTDYGWKERWNMGSFFIKKASKDIFEKAKPIIYQDIEDETVMMELTTNPDIAKRCRRLNITYNLGMRNAESNWQKANKPLKVVHFHPYDKRMNTLDIFMYGKNELHRPLITKRLIKIFNSHGVK